MNVWFIFKLVFCCVMLFWSVIGWRKSNGKDVVKKKVLIGGFGKIKLNLLLGYVVVFVEGFL